MLTISCTHCGQQVQAENLLAASGANCIHCANPLYGARRKPTGPSTEAGRDRNLSFSIQFLAFVLITLVSGVLFFTLSPTPSKQVSGSRQTEKKELLFFTMRGCRPCAGMKETLAKPGVKAALSDWDLRLVGQDKPETRDHGIRGFPTLVAEVNGREVGRIVGYRSPEQLKKWLEGL